MENKTKLTIGVVIALTLLLGSGATYFIAQGDNAYYCESRDMVMVCEKISSGIGTRCYYEETYKVCPEGWEKMEMEQQLNQDQIISSKQIICDQKECVPI